MIIKKYQGPTEEAAIKQAKDDLGPDAVIMNKKTVKYRGFRKLFKKNYCEITAAIDDPAEAKSVQKKKEYPSAKHIDISTPTDTEKETVSSAASDAIEARLNDLAQILEHQMKEARKQEAAIDSLEDKEEKEDGEESRDLVQMVHDKLIENEVTEENAKVILGEIDSKSDLVLDDLLAGVYQKIVLKLGQMKTISLSEEKPKVVYFIGPTGVGKTTTIAKLASKFKLEQKCKIAIVTADTYRIAAVEQIRTYANILSVPIDVIYTADEMTASLEKYANYDLIFVDTAGRSHKNTEQKQDLKALLDVAKEYPHEIYLVISATTKYRDLVQITDVYSDISNYNLLFTKTDETGALGNIVNIRMLTGAPLSYTTFGQNVPDDIGVTDAQKIAKCVLGGND